jgi:hypothetical protein
VIGVHRVTWCPQAKAVAVRGRHLELQCEEIFRSAAAMVVPIEEVKRFMVEAMVTVGTVQQHAEQMADVLVAADYMGHYSHGLNRLGEWSPIYGHGYFAKFNESGATINIRVNK